MRAAGTVSALTAVSRVLGLVREQVFAMLLGAGDYADAFNTAFRFPNLLRDLFAEGALSSAFIPNYARELAKGGTARAYQLSSRLLTVLAVLLGAVTAMGFVSRGRSCGRWPRASDREARDDGRPRPRDAPLPAPHRVRGVDDGDAQRPGKVRDPRRRRPRCSTS